jgi:hypothetical protein
MSSSLEYPGVLQASGPARLAHHHSSCRFYLGALLLERGTNRLCQSTPKRIDTKATYHRSAFLDGASRVISNAATSGPAAWHARRRSHKPSNTRLPSARAWRQGAQVVPMRYNHAIYAFSIRFGPPCGRPAVE